MKEKDDIFLESTEEFETRCFLHIYKELKTLDGNKLDADSLLRLLKQRNIHQNLDLGYYVTFYVSITYLLRMYYAPIT